jgi:hypothetical protein
MVSGDVVKLENHSSWVALEGTAAFFYVAGEIQNLTASYIRAEIVAEVFEDNVLVGSGPAPVFGYVAPGEKGCFRGRFPVDGSGTYVYTLHQPGYWSYQALVESLTVSNVQADSTTGQVTVSGTISNSLEYPVSDIEVATTLYSSNLTVIDCNPGLPEATTLAPGATTQFSSLHNQGAPYGQFNSVSAYAGGIVLGPTPTHTPGPPAPSLVSTPTP